MAEMKPVVVVTHAAFSERRHIALMGLMSDLRIEAPGIPIVLQEDWERKGSLWCWLEGHKRALAEYPEATHLIQIPDDGLICKDYGKILMACIKSRPDDLWDAFVNMPLFRTHAVNTPWFSTSDGYTGMGGCFPRALLEEYLRWREERPELGNYPDDASVNLFMADTGRLVFKTSWSLVQHNDSMPSLDGHDAQARDGHERKGLRPVREAMTGVRSDVMNFLGRTYLAPEEHMPGFASACTPLGLTYKSNVFDLVRRLKPEHWSVDAMYQAYEPTPADGKPRVVIVVPTYQESIAILDATQPSRDAVIEDLEAHGIEAVQIRPPGDSLVERMRQRATHMAMKMGATSVLFWDADISCDDPKTVRRMLLSGHDIVAGACPFKNDKRKVVCNLHPEAIERLQCGEGLTTLPGGFVEALHVGSGFMMISRRAIIALMDSHKDKCHLSRSPGDYLEPLWAIWQAECNVTNDVWQRVFLSEDWNISRMWQDLGGRVFVHAPSTFKHWGLHAYEASFAESFNLETGK